MVGSASVLHITSIYNMVEENMTCFMQRKGENPMVFVLDTNKRPQKKAWKGGGGTCVRCNSSPCLKAGASLRKFRDYLISAKINFVVNINLRRAV